MRYRNHRQAGQELAERLLEWAGSGDLTHVIVLALPRGGVPIGAEIARALKAPLDVLVVRKIGVPGAPEIGIGAIVDDDPPLFDAVGLEAMQLDEHKLGSEVAGERAELYRREGLYRAGRPAPHVTGRTVVLVDDGLATGITARAALRHLHREAPHRLILAVPVCSRYAARELQEEADDVICLHQPQHLGSVGEWYSDFEQVSDQEVLEALETLRDLHPA
ncbi:phosphoribosyltransferase [Streptomyces sp. NPDC055722]